MIWCIFGSNLQELYIEADSFDEALKKARLTNPNYVGGYVMKKEMV